MKNEEDQLVLPKGMIQNLKTLGFLTVWFTIPVVLVSFVLSGQPVSPAVQMLPAEPQATEQVKQTTTIPLMVSFSGVTGTKIPQQTIFFQAKDIVGVNTVTLNSLAMVQDATRSADFHANLEIPSSYLAGEFTIWIKGPKHLQRKFDNMAITPGMTLDLTEKPLLSGDLPLPQEGQDDQVTELDRDYLWSIIAKNSQPTKQELQIADLDLDGKVTGRDLSLLLDTGVGTEGER